MGEITLRDLHDMRAAITGDTRHEVSRVEQTINRRIDEVRGVQDQHNERLNEHGAELGQLRAVIQDRTAPLGVLTKPQKKLLWGAAAAVGAACLEGISHLAVWGAKALANLFVAGGVRP